MELTDSRVDKLVRVLEEATRASQAGVTRFIEPARGTLDRAKSARHHVIFGRRGSGKSSLLRKTATDLSLERKPVAYVDLEAFKGHSYPDVLLSVIIAAVRSFEEWLNGSGAFSASHRSFWQKLTGTAPTIPPIPKKQREEVIIRLRSMRGELEKLLYAQDAAEIEVTTRIATSRSRDDNFGISLKTPAVEGTATYGNRDGAERAEERKEATKRSKSDFLHRSILRFQELFKEIAELGAGRAYLILDDLYHIRREDQAWVDYFHRIAKNTGVWIKVGTIRHRTDHYRHGNPPIGMKLGDDADEIDLDVTLEKYELAKDFLRKILDGLLAESEINSREELLAPTAADRLVLASGGVARDFLTIFRRAIEFGRERGDDARGPRVAAEDVNRASGEHDSSKRDELRRDTAEDSAQIEIAFGTVRDFCLNRTHANCFLVERDGNPDGRFIIDELVDLKMLHLVHSRVTIPDKQGVYHVAYMLDLSQYAQDRTRRGFQMIPFWEADAKDALRRIGLVLDLNQLPKPTHDVTHDRNSIGHSAMAASPN